MANADENSKLSFLEKFKLKYNFLKTEYIDVSILKK